MKIVVNSQTKRRQTHTEVSTGEKGNKIKTIY